MADIKETTKRKPVKLNVRRVLANESLPVFLKAGSILLGGIIISLTVIFAGRGDLNLFAGVGERNTDVTASECTGDNMLQDECFPKYAKDLDLDLKKFEECVSDEKYYSVIDDEITAGENFGVQATPTFFIGKGDGEEFKGFYMGGARYQEVDLVVQALERGSVEEAHAEFLAYLEKSLTEFEPQVREYYASEQGGGLTGVDLDSAVSQVVDGERAKLSDEYVLKTLTAGDGVVVGDGEIVFMEFSDYQCPFCKQFAAEVLVDLKADFIDTGRARYIFRDFPLEQIHPQARAAANAARCAGEQGKYFEYHDVLFEIN